MTSSCRPLFRVCLLAGWLALFSPALQAAPLSIAQLMTTLARQPQAAATFTEKKTLAMLEQPLESSGELLYTAPNRLEKRTLKPRAETMVLDDNTLTLSRGRRQHVLQLQDYPEVAGMVESIRATLAGDRHALERFYTLALSGEMEAWTLQLVPIDPRVGKLIARIQIAGGGNEVRSVEVLQVDGDRSLMRITPTGAQ